jgi:hypothetical protein
MPDKPKTQHRSVRINDQDWKDLAAHAPKGDRSAVIKELVAWYLRRSGAKLPPRPDPRQVEHPEFGRKEPAEDETKEQSE